MPMQPRDNVVNNEANKPLSVFMDNEVSYYPYHLLCGGLVYKKKVWRWIRLSKWRLWKDLN